MVCAKAKNIGVIFLLLAFILTVGMGIASSSAKPDIQSYSDSFYKSVNYNPRQALLSFTIPKKVPQGYKFYLHVSGRMYMGNKLNLMSFHAFDKESQNYSWISGKTYTYHLVSESFAECLLVFGIVDKNKKELLYAIEISPDGKKHIEKTE